MPPPCEAPTGPLHVGGRGSAARRHTPCRQEPALSRRLENRRLWTPHVIPSVTATPGLLPRGGGLASPRPWTWEARVFPRGLLASL